MVVEVAEVVGVEEVVEVVIGAISDSITAKEWATWDGIVQSQGRNEVVVEVVEVVVVEVVVVEEEAAVQVALTATKRDTCHASAPRHHVVVVAAVTVGDVVEIEDAEAVAETKMINPVMY